MSKSYEKYISLVICIQIIILLYIYISIIIILLFEITEIFPYFFLIIICSMYQPSQVRIIDVFFINFFFYLLLVRLMKFFFSLLPGNINTRYIINTITCNTQSR